MELIDPHAPTMPVSGAQADGLAALYRARFPEFVRVATAIAGSAEDGYEAVQDAFADVLGRGVVFGDDATAGYVWRAVVNAARDARRRGARRRRREEATARWPASRPSNAVRAGRRCATPSPHFPSASAW